MKINLVDTINQVRKYRPNGKKIIRTTNLKFDLFRIGFGGMCIFCALLCLRCIMLEKRNNVVENTLASISGENITELSSTDLISKTTEIKEEYNYAQSLISENDKLYKEIQKLAAGIVELDKENVDLVESNEEYYKELSVLRERAELYEEYEYALVYNEERTDITYDQLKTGIDICNEAGVNPHLLFAFIMAESHGDETAKNIKSTATGYGQLLNSTAKFVYEDLMDNGKGTFISTLSKDGDTNIEMTARYIAYLKENNSSIDGIIIAYAGEDNSGYKAELNSWLAKAGTNLTEINNELY